MAYDFKERVTLKKLKTKIKEAAETENSEDELSKLTKAYLDFVSAIQIERVIEPDT